MAAGGRVSPPVASRCACSPSLPNRARTSLASSAARCPSVRKPSRRNKSINSGVVSPSSLNQRTGSGATNRDESPEGTTIAFPVDIERAARLAAIAEAERPSAIPTPTEAPPVASRTIDTSRSAIGRSPPKYRDGPSAAKHNQPGSTTSRRGAISATARTIGSNSRASRSGS